MRAKKKAGRPRRNYVERVRTMAWFQAVRVASDLKINELDRLFGSGTSGTWSRYRIGSISPSTAALRKVEQKYVGTSRYYMAGFWELGSHPIPAPVPVIRAAIDTSLLLKWKTIYIAKGASEASVFWRTPLTVRYCIRLAAKLMIRSPLDSATLLLASLHQTALAQDASGFVIAAEAWARFCHHRHKLAVLGMVYSEFFRRIEEDVYAIMKEHDLFSSATKHAAHRNEELDYFDPDEEAMHEETMYRWYGKSGKY